MANLVLNVVSIKDGPSLTNVATSIPTDFDGLAAWLPGGRDQILENALANLTISAQSFARGKLGAKKENGSREFSDADVRKAVSEWKPGEGRKTMSEYSRLSRAIADLKKLGLHEQAKPLEAQLAKMPKPAEEKAETPKSKPAPVLVRGKGKKAA